MLFLKLWLILKSNVLLILKIRLYLIILDINILEYYLIKVRKIWSNFNIMYAWYLKHKNSKLWSKFHKRIKWLNKKNKVRILKIKINQQRKKNNNKSNKNKKLWMLLRMNLVYLKYLQHLLQVENHLLDIFQIWI